VGTATRRIKNNSKYFYISIFDNFLRSLLKNFYEKNVSEFLPFLLVENYIRDNPQVVSCRVFDFKRGRFVTKHSLAIEIGLGSSKGVHVA
jgi:hypothetical protein